MNHSQNQSHLICLIEIFNKKIATTRTIEKNWREKNRSLCKKNQRFWDDFDFLLEFQFE